MSPGNGSADISPPETWLFSTLRDTPYSFWRSLTDPWPVPLDAFQLLHTFLPGIVPFDNDLLPRTWSAADVLHGNRRPEAGHIVVLLAGWRLARRAPGRRRPLPARRR